MVCSAAMPHDELMRSFTSREKIALAGRFLSRHREISNWGANPQPVIRERQFRQVKRLVDVAFHHTEFYRRKYSVVGVHPRDIQDWSDFAQLPTVTKPELIDAGLGAVNDRCRIDRLFVSRSSGSTGQFVTVYLDSRAVITQALQAYRMLHEVAPGYGPRDRELLVYTSEYPYSSIGGLYRARYVSTLSSAGQILEEIRRYRPAILAIYPSILRELLELDGHVLMLPLKGVLTNSEYSSQEERDAFARQMDCPVSDEFSSEELSSIAYQCLRKSYHLTQDASYIELLRPGFLTPAPSGEVGEIVGTCLINEATPIIRYHQGDLAVLGDRACVCGRTAPTLESLAGRMNASFRRRDGSLVPSGRILDWTYSLILTHRLGIRQFQVTQEKVDLVTIDLVVTDSYDPDVHHRMLTESFRELFGDSFVIWPRIVTDIERMASGKSNPIRSLVGGSSRF